MYVCMYVCMYVMHVCIESSEVVKTLIINFWAKLTQNCG